MAEEQKTLSEQIQYLKTLLEHKSALTSVELGENTEPTAQGKVYECLNEFVEKPINDISEVGVKKVFATAIAASKSAGTLPENMVQAAGSAIGIASISDEALTRVKTAYQVATGQLQAEEVADVLIDKAAARVTTVAQTLICKGADIAVKTVGKVVERVFPPAKVVMPVVSKVVSHVAEKVSSFVASGIQKVASVAKTIAHKAIEKGRKVVQNVKGFFKRLFS